MATPEDINEQLAAKIAEPASTTIEGNTVVNRPLAEFTQAADIAAANEQAKRSSGGVKRERFRHSPPGGGAPN